MAAAMTAEARMTPTDFRIALVLLKRAAGSVGFQNTTRNSDGQALRHSRFWPEITQMRYSAAPPIGPRIWQIGGCADAYDQTCLHLYVDSVRGPYCRAR